MRASLLTGTFTTLLFLTIGGLLLAERQWLWGGVLAGLAVVRGTGLVMQFRQAFGGGETSPSDPGPSDAGEP